MLRVVVCVSGGGTNLQAIIDGIHEGSITNTKLVGVISNNRKARALERAVDNQIPAVCVSPKDYENRELFHAALLTSINDFEPDYIVLAGFLVTIPPAMTKQYGNRILNIHPSLLPKYGGMGMYGMNVHEAVLANGETESGCSCHLVNEKVDQGRVLVQKKVAVKPDDTPASLRDRILPLEHICLVEGLLIAIAEMNQESIQ